jgi:hypothetical protein
MPLETLVYSPLNHLGRMIAREYLIEFSHRESFKLCIEVVRLLPITLANWPKY